MTHHIQREPFDLDNADPNQARELFRCPSCWWRLLTFRPFDPDHSTIEALLIEEAVITHELWKHGIHP